MKRLFVLLIMMLLLTTACSENREIASETSVPPEPEKIFEPVFASDLKVGSYEIEVDSSSSMFRVIHCQLIVKEDKMESVMTMSGQGYGMLYMGTGEEALFASEEQYIPFVLNENGEKTFTVPVEALNKEIDCAAWSIKKEKWYDRILVFRSDMLPEHAFYLE